jgi:hypothetical protein
LDTNLIVYHMLKIMDAFTILTNQDDSHKSQACEFGHFYKLTTHLVTVNCLSIHIRHFTC